MRKDKSKGKIGKIMVCPKCRYKWRVKNPDKILICCSNCKRYFKKQDGIKQKKKRQRKGRK